MATSSPSQNDAGRPAPDRKTIERRTHAIAGLSLAVVSEDIRSPTDWSFEEPHHSVVVHLDGRLRRMESVFSRGPSARRLPQVGDIWAVPAGCRYAALAQGDAVRYAEFRLAADGRHDRDMAARIGHRDPRLHQAALRAAALASRNDDVAGMALPALLQAVSRHLAEHYLGVDPTSDSKPAARFSDRQCAQLVDFVQASLAQPLSVEALAGVVNASPARFSERFRASFGISPWQYVLDVRLQWAQAMLRTTQRPITDIAIDAGFASASHFATRFAAHVGSTPSRFRQHGH